MHARHRSPGNGYRSSSTGIGLAASRISPETSGRGHGFYNSEHRNFKRGLGRGQSHLKSFQLHPPTPRKGSDIFMEAGRLAAEYLVSQGLLPPSVLPAKWQNGSLKKQMGDYQDYMSQEVDNLHLPLDGRTSVLARLGNATSDLGLDRRRYLDDYNSTGSRNVSKGRRKEGSYRSYRSDWGQEQGRSGSWSDRIRASPYLEVDEDSISGHHEEPLAGKDVGNGLQKPVSSEFAPKSEELDNSEFDDKYNLQHEMGSKASTFGAGKDLKLESDGELLNGSDDSTNFSSEVGELKDGRNNVETEEDGTMKDLSYHHSSTEDDPLVKTCADLLAMSKFAKVPTKTRSSLTLKNLKADSVATNEQESVSDIGTTNGPQVLLEDSSLGGSFGDMLLNKSQDPKCSDSEYSKDLSFHSFGDVRYLDHIYDVEKGKCSRSQSFPNRALLLDNEHELVQGMPGLQRSSPMVVVKERGGKRGLELSDLSKGAKKPREWLRPVTNKVELLPFSDFGDEKGPSVEGTASPSEKVGATVDKEIQDSLVTNSQFPDGDGESSVNYAQEKQLLPNAFKICDLNLMEASDINENHHNDPINMYSTASETKNEAATIDRDLSMRNSNNSGGGNRHTSNCKEIEVIDLKNDSTQEDKGVDNLERKCETMFVSMNGDMTDVPDHYDGLTITEFLRNFSNCPSEDINPYPQQNENINSLQIEDINPLQNGMCLHNGEGTLGDDDSIYMSLGEIPLSFLPAWPQPPVQEYEKPF
ncbi:uncharacterized protein At4g26450-like [Durio zibethinus]|uniref:Uncharacterized protein At4g26450-like n=1 Tax=Durio zibethinus TaxID=66656 RepID=A0A6P5ZKA9_DURZI|nr:uncharacterized protein At4g26450-like [Durio zibethinus]XP_022752946.1 uncharacterized protein At4g26450-like [Durio zibethinus]XP_022752947.1 uncharacterized protein At4g26450-like [Durio zibethinus]XP_022752948.1 uncharacterized protein At4g26450-like [Durio zibethinus]XP_022752949.1 uncharacterized protein At4g26450-like [Durio zibethinus]XP_022752950.1 uncharacterized protein At4g26450-like [Durio zibethinus]XP_022752951.1 uncharacterized protein At4g26450-like [Durio zibethinus]XP_0